MGLPLALPSDIDRSGARPVFGLPGSPGGGQVTAAGPVPESHRLPRFSRRARPSRDRPSGHLVPVARHDSVSRSCRPTRPVSRRPSSASAPTAGRACPSRRATLVARAPRSCSAASATSALLPRRRGPGPRAVAVARCATGCPTCWSGTPAATSSCSPSATRWSPASAHPGRAARRRRGRGSSRRSRRWRWPGPGWAGRPSRSTVVTPGRPRPARWCCAQLAPGPPGAGAVLGRRRRPAAVAGLLRRCGLRRSRDDRARRPRQRPRSRGVDGTADDLVRPTRRDSTWSPSSWPARSSAPGPPGLPDDAFEHDGQLTKRDLRACALARLAPRPASCSGTSAPAPARSASSGCARTRRCRAIAIEADPERAARIGRNAAAPRRTRASRWSPAAHPTRSTELPAPDAIFVGGGATAPGVLDDLPGRAAARRPAGRARRDAGDRDAAGAAVRRARRRADPDLGRARRAARLVHRLDAGPRRHPVGA